MCPSTETNASAAAMMAMVAPTLRSNGACAFSTASPSSSSGPIRPPVAAAERGRSFHSIMSVMPEIESRTYESAVLGRTGLRVGRLGLAASYGVPPTRSSAPSSMA